MFTQCPDCSTAFRVTAEVLKQAAGKVRCGGCGVAFNALEYLSEQMPEQPASKEVEEHLPELTPEPTQPDEQAAPAAISAEQSAALLKTLDELAGSDIRIEDTGVEWRVLDEADGSDDSASMSPVVDELLDESPTPVDQFLTQTPNDIDASEIFEASANAPAQTPVEELRFDDNTPLPDDFDLDDESSYVPEAPETGTAGAESPEHSAHPRELDEAAAEMALGEPEEWADILGEFSEPPQPYVPPLDAELAALSEAEPDDAIGDEPSGAGDVDTPLDVDTQFALQAEAMGIDLSGLHATLDEDAPEDAVDVSADEAAERKASVIDEESDDTSAKEAAESLPDEEAPDEDKPGENAPSENAIELELAETGAARARPDTEADEETGEVPELELADETGEAVELDAEPDDEPPEAADIETQEEADDGDSEPVDDTPLEFGSIEQAMADLEEQSDVFDGDYFDHEADEGAASEEAHEGEVALDDEFEDGRPEGEIDDGEGFAKFEDGGLDEDVQGDDVVIDEDLEDDDAAPEAGIEGDDGELEEQQEFIEAPRDEASPHVVPPLSEEEQTINLLIDQELLSMAVEDEDGFASTIIVAEKDAKEAIAEAHAEQPREGDGFESIIMEGEFVRSALDQEKRKADIAEAAELAEKARQAREAEEQQTGSGKRRGMAAAAVLLVVLLVAQVLHQSREALATIPLFNETVGPVYRAIGMPLSPAWDVTGWRFEARRDVLDDEADTLTVISRIGNTSDDALPYPLINVSLTDRFEETVGTKTLDPADYLTDDLDASEMVRPGNNFTAVMTIQSPAENATGYKLQACYRQPDAQLRCHVPTFK